jgi:hypothetical protein
MVIAGLDAEERTYQIGVSSIDCRKARVFREARVIAYAECETPSSLEFKHAASRARTVNLRLASI